MKKILVVLCISVIAILPFGCASNNDSDKSSNSSITQQSSSSPQAEHPAPVPQAVTTQQVQQPAEVAPPQTPNEKKYYGAGPNGEGIKGHIDNKKGTKIYHLPGDPYYSRTTHVAQWFFTEKEAQAAGYRHIYK